MGEWKAAFGADELGTGEMREFDDRGEPVVVARTEAGLFAFEGYCTHEECPLSEGRFVDHEVECYCHGSYFDIRTGEALVGPAVESLETYRTREQDGEIQVEM
jgi:3-phenylpropionate/trans-cinnamate dioxygenase ferredoxin component